MEFRYNIERMDLKKNCFGNTMITAPKVSPHVVLARKWGKGFIARPNMSKKWGRGPTNCEYWVGLWVAACQWQAFSNDRFWCPVGTV